MTTFDGYWAERLKAKQIADEIVAIDARTRMNGMMRCDYDGAEFNKEHTRRCKFYDISRHRSCCMWYNSTIDDGHCSKVGG